MTRVNCGVQPNELTSQHLNAEHREIKRIPNQIVNNKIYPTDIPPSHRMGRGHIKFFTDKLMYLYLRYELIYQEMIRRGFNASYFGGIFSQAIKRFPHLANDFTPGVKERSETIARLKDKDSYYFDMTLENGKFAV